ncbi:two-component system osmolarity sensor histidine kinase EnvZ [Collimonas sp. PA-H2]|uniref:sensor histidine kinase n=1 Tax=Collimonas sp. PA-H2 TaxID=1881062 RepID=UPI000BF7AC5B|nr:sensor histidine kinase [Collimonas sp. PA-H2]PFH04432.1 two-component system osmolarity sensor histidine kinase EnvZ [Collimonas sp. PA-H2]
MVTTNRLAWLKSGLLWRTFFMLAFLITVSMVTWIASFRIVERGPRAQALAAQIISIVTITRAALTHSAPDLRRELLFDLASNEGIRIYPLEDTDQIDPPVDDSIMPDLEKEVRAKLGNQTRFSSKVNEIGGFWVSFKIDGDEYWLVLDRERVERGSGVQWLQWASVALILSLLGAMFISTLINQPLSRLTAATRAVAKGLQPDPLPETGPTEIEEANRSFNQMVSDLQRIESDRAIILAGISHDLRTPLARMLLEVEMANLSDDARSGMQSDLAQMDGIIGQFLHYAKPTDTSSFERINLSELIENVVQTAERQSDIRILAQIAPDIHVSGNETELRRVLNNVIENSRRYGKKDGDDCVTIDINCQARQDRAIVILADHGPGIPDSEIDRLLRPFTRLDVARGQANGSGLGLAIVSRIVKQHGGKLRLSNREGGGLSSQIELQLS